MVSGTPRLFVGPEQLKGFLEVPGADSRRVPHRRPHQALEYRTPADLFRAGRLCRIFLQSGWFLLCGGPRLPYNEGA